MKKNLLLALLIGGMALSGCGNKDKDETEASLTRPRESDFVESKETDDLEEEIVENTEKKHLDELKTESVENPKSNERPEENSDQEEGEESQAASLDVSSLTVTPDALEENADVSADLLPEKFIPEPQYEINNPAFSGTLVDVYRLEEGADVHGVEKELGVNITMASASSRGQQVLIVPREYNGILKINEVSFNSDLGGYEVGDEYVNVYMAQGDAILFDTKLSEDKPNILLTYYDEQGNYSAQSLLDYQPDQGTINLNRGFNFVN